MRGAAVLIASPQWNRNNKESPLDTFCQLCGAQSDFRVDQLFSCVAAFPLTVTRTFNYKALKTHLVKVCLHFHVLLKATAPP